MTARTFGAAIVMLLIVGVVIVSGSSAQPGTETIIVEESFGNRKTIVHGSKLRAGDTWVERSPLWDDTRTRVGTSRTVCTLHFGSENRKMLCARQLALKGRGTIQIEGVIHLGDAPDLLVIVGGTGDFVDVGGTESRTAFPGRPTVKLTLEVIRH